LNVFRSDRIDHNLSGKGRKGGRLPIEVAAQTIDHCGENPTAIKIGKDPVHSSPIEVWQRDFPVGDTLSGTLK
jgi:hypothetical protein